MWNIILLIILIIGVVMFKRPVKETFQRVKANTKVSYRPKYRDYNPMIKISEQVQFEVIPSMGITATLIRENYNDVMEKMLTYKSENIALKQLPNVLKATVTHDYPHYTLFEIFFKEIQQTDNNTYPLHEILVAIKFGL